ncbi:MAG: thymidylate synthase [Methylobacter sp.]
MKTIPMKNYYDLLQDVLESGDQSDDRTGVGTLSLFGRQLRFDLNEGFPLLPGKFTSFKGVAAELLWFLSGSTNNEDLRRLNDNDRPTIWKEWQDENGDLGPIYGQQWRSWPAEYIVHDGAIAISYIDQMSQLIKGLKDKPFSRRHLVSAWNVADLPDESVSPQKNVKNGKMALAPCHCLFQFHVREIPPRDRAIMMNDRFDKDFLTSWETEVCYCHESTIEEIDAKYIQAMDAANIPKYALSCQLYQRSADLFLGVPYNIASYALLTHMIAEVTNMSVGELIISFGDVHIYLNHVEQAKELLSRDLSKYPLSTLCIKNKIASIDDFKLDDLKIVGYKSHPAIKAEVAI